MRRVVEMLRQLAIENLKESVAPEQLAAHTLQVSEAFNYVDSYMGNPSGANPAKLKEAMGIADFPTYLGQAVSRSFYSAYPMRVGAWKDFTYPDSVPDFREVSRMRTSEVDTLVKRNAKGENKATHVDESEVRYKAEEYTRAFGLNWQLILSDDLGEIAQFPKKLLRAATRFEDSFVSGLYNNSTSKSALVSLGANYSANLPLTVEGVMAGYAAFLNRVDERGNPINVPPKYLVASSGNALKVKEILGGIDVTNLVPQLRVTKDLLEYRADPYITNGNWYLFSDPDDVRAVSVARIRGYEQPQIFLKQPDMVPFSPTGSLGAPSWLTGSFENGEIEFMVLDIIGGWTDDTYKGVTDYQGIFYSSNA